MRFTLPNHRRSYLRHCYPESFNRYLYAEGDPVNGNDPSGLCDDWILGITMSSGAAAGLASGAIVAFPYSSTANSGNLGVLQGVLQVAAQVFAPTSSTYTAISSLVAAAADQQPINVVTFSGGAEAFTKAVSFLNSHGQQSVTGLISNITYISPGAIATPLYDNGNTAVLLGNNLLDNLVTGGSMFGLLGVKPQVAPNCGHKLDCIAGYFSNFLSDRSGSDCSAPTMFNQGNYNSPSPGFQDPFSWLNRLYTWTWVTSKITFPPESAAP